MKTLIALIKNNAWLSIELALLDLYPDEKEKIVGYQKMFNKLQLISPIPTDISIVVKGETDDFDNTKYVDVSGKYKNPKTEEEQFSQALEFTPWSEWLAMEIAAESLQNFNELEIIAHCLYEMTFIGFEEEEIQEKIQNIEAEAEKYKNMTEEERKENTISLDELFKDLDDEGKGTTRVRE